jgi:hypothetical protein
MAFRPYRRFRWVRGISLPLALGALMLGGLLVLGALR